MEVRHVEITERATGWATRLCTVSGCTRLVSWPQDDPTAPVCVLCWDVAVDEAWIPEVA